MYTGLSHPPHDTQGHTLAPNWQLTRVNQLRNVLRLITALAFECRDVASIDPGGSEGVFFSCPGLKSIFGDSDSDS